MTRVEVLGPTCPGCSLEHKDSCLLSLRSMDPTPNYTGTQVCLTVISVEKTSFQPSRGESDTGLLPALAKTDLATQQR